MRKNHNERTTDMKTIQSWMAQFLRFFYKSSSGSVTLVCWWPGEDAFELILSGIEIYVGAII